MRSFAPGLLLLLVSSLSPVTSHETDVFVHGGDEEGPSSPDDAGLMPSSRIGYVGDGGGEYASANTPP